MITQFRAMMFSLSERRILIAARCASGGKMCVYMVVEKFRNGDAAPVYRRFRDHGRLAPAGLSYVSSWVDERLERCWQVMETEDGALLDQWIGKWSDIIDFEVHPVISSNEAVEKIDPRL